MALLALLLLYSKSSGSTFYVSYFLLIIMESSISFSVKTRLFLRAAIVDTVSGVEYCFILENELFSFK